MHFKLDPTEGRPKRKVKKIYFSQFGTDENMETDPLQNDKNTEPDKELKDNVRPSRSAQILEKSGHEI